MDSRSGFGSKFGSRGFGAASTASYTAICRLKKPPTPSMGSIWADMLEGSGDFVSSSFIGL